MRYEVRHDPNPSFFFTPILYLTDTPSVHDDSHMVVHVLRDIAQEARSEDTHGTERDRDVVYPFVRLRVGQLASIHDHLVGAWDVFDAWELFEEGENGLRGATVSKYSNTLGVVSRLYEPFR